MMRSYDIDVTLQGSSYFEKGDGPEAYTYRADVTQKVEIFMDAESAEEAEQFALDYDYANHRDCEIDERCEIFNYDICEYGIAENLPTEVMFHSCEIDC